MKKAYLLVILVFFSFTSLSAQENYRISDLDISGNKSISERKLKKRLTLKDRSSLQKLLHWKKANKYHESDLNSDLELLKNIYQKEGFLDVLIDYEILKKSENETVEIKFSIEENAPVLIEEVNYLLKTSSSADSSNLQPLLNQLTRSINLKQGSRFKDNNLLKAQSQLRKWLVKQGYAYQQVSYNIQLKKELNLVIIDFIVETGPLCYFGSTTFVGVQKVPYSILEKQLLPSGKIYSEKTLQILQRKLQRLGMFQYVTVRGVLDDQHSKTIPIQVELKEASRLSFKFGIGYGQEDKFRTSITVTKLGFLGGIRKAVFFAKYSSLEPYNLSLKLTQPALFHPDGALTLNPFTRKEDETGFTRSRIGALLIYQIRLKNHLSSYFNYGMEWNKLKTLSPLLEDDMIAEGKGDYRQSSATIGLVYDDSQPIFSPRQGWYLSSALTWAGIGFNSDYHYTMISSEVRKYTSLYKQIVLASRLQGGFMKPIKAGEKTPIADRFYSGGSNSVRGWARSDLGPKSEDDLPLGGNSLLEASVEIRYPIWNILSGVVFCDAGNVWEGTYEQNLNQLEYAGGGGLRIKTPLGPLRFDIAMPLSQSDNNVQFYLNIGEAF